MQINKTNLVVYIFVGIAIVHVIWDETHSSKAPVPSASRNDTAAFNVSDTIGDKSMAARVRFVDSIQTWISSRPYDDGDVRVGYSGHRAESFVWVNPSATDREMAAFVAQGFFEQGTYPTKKRLQRLGFTELVVAGPSGSWRFNTMPTAPAQITATVAGSSQSLAGRMYASDGTDFLFVFETASRFRTEQGGRISRGTYSYDGSVVTTVLDGVGGLNARRIRDAKGFHGEMGKDEDPNLYDPAVFHYTRVK